jgi:DNA uptake protein ComE-like DNA-binding protein
MKVKINFATEKELRQLKGVGQTMAQKLWQRGKKGKIWFWKI